MNKERVVLLLEDLNGKLDLLLEKQEALLKEIPDCRKESNARHYRSASLLQTAIADRTATSNSDGDYHEERAL